MNGNRNQKGFTLAEVLITLGIIGVVAAMTIPTLVTNYQKNMYLNRFKKSYAMVLNGFRNYLAASYCSTNECSKISDYLVEAVNNAKYDNIDDVFDTAFKGSKICKGENEIENCVSKTYEGFNGSELSIGVTNPYGVMFADGSAFTVANGVAGVMLVVLDTNGAQKPNKLGYDAFVFVMDMSDEKIKNIPVIFPYGTSAAGIPGLEVWKDSAALCGNPGEKIQVSDDASGWGCAARIIEEGYKITYY